MGYDLTLIVGQVDEELVCPICADVLEEPMQSPTCEHAFCRSCIEKWLEEKQICPVGRTNLPQERLVPVSRLMRNMLGRLKIKCCFVENGCGSVMSLEEFRSHVANCQSNPKVDVVCTKGCGLNVPKDELGQHNCICELRRQLQNQIEAIPEIKDMLAQQERRLNEHRRELELVQYYIAMLRATNPAISSVGDQLDRFALMRWGRDVPLASVRTWGSLIATPDNSLRLTMRRGLRASSCPMHLTEMLLDCCHEDSWPEGLASLSSRSMNRNQMSQFVARLLPIAVTEKPCVAILGGENSHMPENLRPVLGMVLVFVDGVDESNSDPELAEALSSDD